MSAFTRMADRYEEVEAENGQLHMQVRKLKAEVEELVDAWEREVEELEREIRLMRQQYDRRVEERDELLAAMERIESMANNYLEGGWPTVYLIDESGAMTHPSDWDIQLEARQAVAKAKGGE